MRAQDDLTTNQLALQGTLEALREESVEGMRSIHAQFDQLHVLSGGMDLFSLSSVDYC